MTLTKKRGFKLTGDSPRVRRRQFIEQTIAAAVVEEALRQGYKLSVDNGDDEEFPKEHTKTEVLKLMFETDEEHLYLQDASGKTAGWVFFVYGNDGYDVISDYTVSIESVANSPKVFALIEKFEQEG